METFADQIIDFFSSLEIEVSLPEGIAVLYPYQNPEVIHITEGFFRKYYSDTNPRIPLIGINPGRFGGGVTGISFTDPVNLEYACGIKNPFEKRPELSSTFIYKVIQAYGRVDSFFQQFFLTALCPLGFMRDGKNYNYYDEKPLQEAVRPFIKETLARQHAICGFPEDAVCIGEGKNLRFMQHINEELGLFKRIHPLPHPRFVMQYRRKEMAMIVDRYVKILISMPPLRGLE
jgi:hypothetical protein